MNSLEYLLSFQRFGIKLGLDNINYLLEHLGNPHLKFPAIHITGTNGKGSVTAFFTSILENMGYRVGRYISPHLVDFSERIVVNGKPITRFEIDELVTEIRPLIKKMQEETGLGHPTFFEAVTAMAFLHFARHKVDFAVVEVGMGGRYDSTNVVRPCLSVITNVHLEHRDYLGDTIEQIAVEKAGIIKPGIEVVSAAEMEDARKVIEKKALECHSQLFYLGRDFQVSTSSRSYPRQWLNFVGPWSKLDDVEINLAGEFQAVNAALTLMGVAILQKKNMISNDEAALRAGMAAARWPARLEKICDTPFILLDGAHNPSAMRALADSVRALFPERKIILVVAMLADKATHQCLHILRTFSDTIIISQSTYERALSAETLLEQARHVFPNPVHQPSLAGAMQRAIALCGPNDIILVCGSLFNIAEVTEFMSARNCGKTISPV